MINFIDEINAFERWLETNYLTGHSQLLWYKLFMLHNRSGWAEWVTVDNLRLMSMICVSSEKSFIKHRDELVSSGLFEYIKGKKGSPNKYKFISLSKYTVKNTVQTTVKEKHCKKYSTNDSISDSTNDSISDSTNDSISDSTSYSHIKQDEDENKKDIVVLQLTSEMISQIIAAWNSLGLNTLKIISPNTNRHTLTKARISQHSFETFLTTISSVKQSSFLMGQSKSGWTITYDWLIKPDNFIKVMEGTYNSNKGGNNNGRSSVNQHGSATKEPDPYDEIPTGTA